MENRIQRAAGSLAAIAVTLGAACAHHGGEPPSSKEKTMHMKADVKGTDGGPLLTLLGGGLTGWRSWQPHQERLADTRRVVRVQLLAVQFGLEGRPLPDGFSVDSESHALAATLQTLSPRAPVDLVGWSSGGLIALDFALDHPERVRTLTLIEPSAIWALPPIEQLEEPARRELQELRALSEEMVDDVTEAQLAKLICLAGMCSPDSPPLQQLPIWPVWVQHRLSLRNTRTEFQHTDSVERLRRFDRPVLLVKGTGSSAWLHRVVDVLAAHLPRAEVVELPGGHAPQLAATDRFLERLATFQRR
jgi:pimeloyl-ACP methyl ester carboxylesterase